MQLKKCERSWKLWHAVKNFSSVRIRCMFLPQINTFRLSPL